jgi:AbrB family looped-hinge helix DNA binding protein
MKLTTKGQVTVPLAVRRRLGLKAASEVEFRVEGDRAYLIPVIDAQEVKEKIEAYRGIADAGLSTDEILALTRHRP